MSERERKVDLARHGFGEAALGLLSWNEAMARFADAVGSRTGQLIGIGTDAAIPFNIMTEMPEEAGAEFEQVGGGDPWINSRVRVGMAAPELAMHDDADFTIEQDRERGPEFDDWKRRHRIGYSCIANLVKNDRFLIGMGALHDVAQDPMDARDKRIYRALAIALRDAIRLQISLEGQEAKLVARTFETMDRAVFVCGPDGTVSGASRPAIELARKTGWLRLRQDKLELTDADAQARMLLAIRKIIAPGGAARNRPADSLVARNAEGFPLYLEIIAFPMIHDLPLRASALVVAYPPKLRELRAANMARALYRLTPTEAVIASYLLSGKSLDGIAGLCGIGVGTVRTHLKRIFDKTGVRSQVGLVALLSSTL